jgi:hypothetical protein
VSVVVRLGDYRTKDAVAVLRELLVLASRGKVAAFGFCVELKDGTQKTGFTGKYAADPAEALRVATRMSQRLTAIKDLREAPEDDDAQRLASTVRQIRK